MLNWLLEALWPHKCLSCGKESRGEAFCFHCEPSVRTLESEEAIFSFSGAIRKTIQQVKFRPSEVKARRLMGYLVENAARCHPGLDPGSSKSLDPGSEAGVTGLAGITFVPIHWRRRLKRGFDLSSIFAQTLGTQLNLPVYDLLTQSKFSEPLSLVKSKEERLKLTKDRYKLRKQISPQKILLVDDIMTTGATLESAKSVLESAGHEVTCFALAKTPLSS